MINVFGDPSGIGPGLIAKLALKQVLKEMLPYYLPLGITPLLITYVPSFTTWIPRLAMGGP